MKKNLTLALILIMTILIVCAGLAGCKPNKFSVCIYDGETLVWESEKLRKGTEVVPDLPEKIGYTLTLYSDAGCTQAASVPIEIGSSNSNFYIKWKANNYKIAFDPQSGGGVPMESIGAEYDTEVTLPLNTFTRYGEEFAGWSLEPDTYDVMFGDGKRVMNLTAENGATVVLYAVFDAIDSENFIVENGTVMAYTGNSRSIRLPNNATKVAPEAFKDNNNLFRVIIPECYTEIGKGAFEGCSYLTQMTIPFIGGSRTDNRFLAYIFGADNYEDNSYKFGYVLRFSYVSPTVAYISGLGEHYSFAEQCIPTVLRTVVLTGTHSEIPEGAFYMHWALERLIVDSPALTIIGDKAFYGAQTLGTDILTGASLPLDFFNNIEYIGEGAFKTYFAEILTDESFYSGQYSGDNLVSVMQAVAQYAGMGYNLSSIQSLELNKIVSIGAEAFYGQDYMKRLSFGAQLETIGESAFYGTAELTLLELPDSLKTVDNFAFCESGVTQVKIGSGIERIGECAFVAYDLIEVIFMGNNVPEISHNSFGQYLEGGSVLFETDNLGIFVNPEALDDFISGFGGYGALVYERNFQRAGQVYYYMGDVFGYYGEPIAKLTLTEGHGAIVEDPRGDFITDFLYVDYYTNTMYAVLIKPLGYVPEYEGRQAYDGVEYVNIFFGGEIVPYDYIYRTAAINEVIYTDPTTGERSFIPAVSVYNTVHGFGYGDIPEVGAYFMDVDKYGNIASLAVYDETLNKVEIEGPEGTVKRVLEIIQEGSVVWTSVFKVYFFDEFYNLLEVMDLIAYYDVNFNCYLYDLNKCDGIEVKFDSGINDCKVEISKMGTAVFGIDAYIFGGYYIEVHGYYTIPAQEKSYGEDGFFLVLDTTRIDDGFRLINGVTSAKIILSGFDGEAYRVVELALEGEFTFIDPLNAQWGDKVYFSNGLWCIFVDYNYNDVVLTRDANADIKQKIAYLNGKYYVMGYEMNSDSYAFVFSHFGVIEQIGDEWIYTELLRLDYYFDWNGYIHGHEFVETDRTCGIEFLPLHNNGYYIMEDTETEFRGGFFDLYGPWNYGDTETLMLLDDSTAIFTDNSGYVFNGTWSKVDNAMYVYSASYVGSIEQFRFISDDGTVDFHFYTWMNYYNGNKEFNRVNTSALSVYTVIDIYGYKVGEMFQNSRGDFKYIQYTYEFVNGLPVYTQLSEALVAKLAYEGQSGTPFYFVIFDLHGNTLFYVDVIDSENNIGLLDPFTRNYPEPRFIFFTPAPSERKSVIWL